MEGLLATNRAVPEGNYLELAKRMADRLLAWQTPAGGWNFIADQPVKKVGISEKGTTLWSYTALGHNLRFSNPGKRENAKYTEITEHTEK